MIVLTLAAVLSLWASSYVGVPVAWFLATGAMAVIVAILWVTAVMRSVVRKKVFLAAAVTPIVAALVCVVATVHLAEHARFAASENAFDALIRTAGEPTVKLPPIQPTEDQLDALWAEFPTQCPSHIGLYAIRDCEVFPAGYIFYGVAGNMSQDAGFAYLPNGKPPYNIGDGSFEDPQFEHLHGNWYAFTSSW
jgi:hypothetical protein